MTALRGFRELERAVEERCGHAVSTALYPSAGVDTRPFTYMHPSYWPTRGIEGAPTPELFLYVDRSDVGELRLESAKTLIETVEREPLRLGRLAGSLLRVRFTSRCEQAWPSRDVWVARLRTDNRRVALEAFAQEWAPLLLIGVQDGCGGFGGNRADECPNRLSFGDNSAAAVRHLRRPAWWITDHFRNAQQVGALRRGDVVSSADPRYPLQFRKHAFIDSRWGAYARWHTTEYDREPKTGVQGATLFRVERRDGPAPSASG